MVWLCKSFNTWSPSWPGERTFQCQAQLSLAAHPVPLGSLFLPEGWGVVKDHARLPQAASSWAASLSRSQAETAGYSHSIQIYSRKLGTPAHTFWEIMVRPAVWKRCQVIHQQTWSRINHIFLNKRGMLWYGSVASIQLPSSSLRSTLPLIQWISVLSLLCNTAQGHCPVNTYS